MLLKFAVIRSFLVVLCVAFSATTSATVCTWGGNLTENWTKASHVILATAKSSEVLEINDSWDNVRFTFKVNHFYKGDKEPPFFPITSSENDNLFYFSVTDFPGYSVGKSYILFLKDGWLGNCQPFIELPETYDTAESVTSIGDRIDLPQATLVNPIKEIIQLSKEKP